MTDEEIELMKQILAELKEVNKNLKEINDSIVVMSP